MSKLYLTHITNQCTERLKNLLIKTITLAQVQRYEFITPEMLLYYIIQEDEVAAYCKERSIDSDKLRDNLLDYISSQDRVPEGSEYYAMLSSKMVQLFELLHLNWRPDEQNEIKDKDPFGRIKAKVFRVSLLDVLLHLYELDDSIAQYYMFRYFGEEPVELCATMGKHLKSETIPFLLNSCRSLIDPIEDDLDQKISKLREEVNDEEREGWDSPSQQGEEWKNYVTCVNQTYLKKNPLIGREKELERTLRILCRKDKNNPLFVGEPGVGKTAMIYGLARRIEAGEVPEWLRGMRIYALDMGSLMAGTSYHGEFERRMKEVLDGIRRKGMSLLYIDEIHTIMDAGGGNNSLSAAELLKPYLEDGSLRFIGSTTYQEYQKSIANKKAIARRFGLIDIKEPSVEEAIKIVLALRPIYERYHWVTYTDEAIRYAVEQTHALVSDRFLPDKAIDVIDEAGAYLRQNPQLNKQGKPKLPRFQKIDIPLIRQILSEVCRIDAKALASETNAGLKDLDKRIAGEIYGQDEAIRQVVRAVMMSKAGLTEPDKPIASLLFVGPTGVGKTEVCKVLARELGIELVRFDMSEYTEKHTISKLIGSPAGYVGYDEGGLLTSAIRKTPNCVLLLDEIEKAHSDIYNILLQVMDYARLTDNKGNKADFKHVILVMTSNAGAQYANQAAIGFGTGQSKGQAMLGTVKKTFKPEFLNRLSGTVVFNEMDRTMASLILEKKLRQLSQRLAAKNVSMTLTDEAREFLLSQGFTTRYGAREMDRTVNRYLSPLLMEEILFGKLAKGGNATISRKGDGLAID